MNLLAQNISSCAIENEGESSAKRAKDRLREPIEEIERATCETNLEQTPRQQQELPLEPAGPPALPLNIPPILLEGDEPGPPPTAESAPKFALGFAPVTPGVQSGGAVLPQAYGTERLWLAARDPHCLYACWDLTSEQERNYCALATGNQLVLRAHLDAVQNRGVVEVPLLPGWRNCFIQVAAAGRRYVLELGYYQNDQFWTSIAVSEAVSTPQQGIAQDKTVRFAAVPARSVVSQHTKPSAAPSGTPEARKQGQTQQQAVPSKPQILPETFAFSGALRIPESTPQPGAASQTLPDPAFSSQKAPEALHEAELASVPGWSAAQEETLAQIIAWSAAGLEAPSSAEMVQFQQPQVPLGPPVTISSLQPQAEISSPAGGELPRQEGFWFSVNAELVIYGATEPTARVTFGGLPIQLRPDGTFSCRFALPDGRYELPIEADSTQGELRRADLQFYRGTTYHGEVPAHPQNPDLKKPDAGNVPLG